MGDIVYLSEVTGCYRITETGFTATQQPMIQDALERLSLYFSIQYLLSKTKQIQGIQKLLINMIIQEKTLKHRKLFLIYLQRKPYLLLFYPLSIVHKAYDYFSIRHNPNYNEFASIEWIEKLSLHHTKTEY